MYRSLVVGLFLLLGWGVAHAQFNTGDTLSLSVSPQNPKPYDVVTVTPSSTAINLAASKVTVSVDGKAIESGSGAQSVPVVLGGPGTRTTITVNASTAGKSYTASVTLRPADVSLIVDPTSTEHPFYKAAGLVAPSGRVRLVALADLRSSPTARLDPSTLIYTWKLGDQVLEASSGIGRSVLVAQAPVRYRDAQVTVTVTSPDSSLVAEDSTVVSPVDPVVRIYHTDPLMGPDFDHALSGSYAMKGAEDAFRAVAYYFGAAPSLSWTVNGEYASSDQNVTVRSTGAGEGTANLAVVASDSGANQSATANLPVHFGVKSTNIFGF